MSHYLSRVWINPLRSQARRLLADPQAMHAAVLGGIPTQPVDERVLWRLDEDEPRRPALLVVTESMPSWEHLVEQAGWPSASGDDPQALTRSYGPVLDQLDDGQRYGFRLTANPVQNVRREGPDGSRLRSERVGHRTATHQLDWFLARCERWGFGVPSSSSSTESMGEEVLDVRIRTRARRVFRRGKSGRVTLQVVCFEGSLEVTDATLLRAKLVEGIGPAKAYGCGLMTLAPPDRLLVV